MTWTDAQGTSCSGKGECVDISEGGIKLRMQSPLDVRGYVSIKFRDANLHGAASVRSCVRNNLTYLVGLEFTRGLKLRG
ncbi:MAG: PilZ domain-containing protein [Acidobacteria bacterium]|nr:PilZ domain-containing protein [Acidobacteriota bacterium]